MKTKEKRIVLWSVVTFILVLFALCIVAFFFNGSDIVTFSTYNVLTKEYQTYSAKKGSSLSDVVKDVQLDGYEFGGFFTDNTLKERVDESEKVASKTYVALYLKVIKNKEELSKITKNDRFLTIKYGKNAKITTSELAALPKEIEVLDLAQTELEGGVLTPGLFSTSALKRIALPKNIAKIESSAFKNCYYLASVSGIESFQSIGDSAFYNCKMLETLQLKSVKEIGEKAFAYTAIESLALPASLEIVSAKSFLESNIKSLSLEENPLYCLENSLLYTKDHASVVYAVSDQTSYNIDSRATAIAPYAFAFSSAKSVSISGAIGEIGEYAFYNCQSLENISAPNALKLVIGEHAFAGTSRLVDFDSMGSITSIGARAFESSGIGSITLETQLESLGERAFKGCQNLTSIDLPGVLNLGSGAFENCTALSQAKLGNIKTIKESTFYGCASLQRVETSEVETIENYAFCGCTSLASLGQLQDASKVGVGAFKNCASLDGVNFDNLSVIEYEAFANCTNLSYANFDSATTIKARAFCMDEKLKTFVLKSGVTSLDDSAFEQSGLERIDSLSPQFYSEDGVLYNSEKNAIICYPLCKNDTSFTIKANISSILSTSFYLNKNLEEILVEPENSTFESFLGVLYNVGRTRLIKYPNNKAYSSAIIYTTVTCIEKYAFMNNQNVADLRILDNVEQIEGGALAGMAKLRSLSVAFVGESKTQNSFIGYAFGGQSYQDNASVLPSTLKKVELTNQEVVPAYAFYGCRWLESITASDKVKVASEYAFANLSSLTDLYFAGKVERMMDYSIYSLSALNTLTFMFNDDLALSSLSLGQINSNVSVRVLKDNSKSSMQQRSLLRNKFTAVYNLSSSWKWYFDYE